MVARPVTFRIALAVDVLPLPIFATVFDEIIFKTVTLSTCVEPVTLIVLLAVIVLESTDVLAVRVPVNTDVLAVIDPVKTEVLAVNAPVSTDVLAVSDPVVTDVLACTVLTVTDVPEISVAITFGVLIDDDTLNVPELDPVIETVEILELTVTFA